VNSWSRKVDESEFDRQEAENAELSPGPNFAQDHIRTHEVEAARYEHVRDELIARQEEVRNSIPSEDVPPHTPAYALKELGEAKIVELRQHAELANSQMEDAEREIEKGGAYLGDDDAFLDA
jgi:hypothetical protein